MATLNISLPGPMEAFVRAQCERDYGNVSEYFRTLVREQMKQEIGDDLRFLELAIPPKGNTVRRPRIAEITTDPPEFVGCNVISKW